MPKSYEQLQNEVYQAWSKLVSRPSADSYAYVAATFPDHIVGMMDGKYYEVDYKRDGDEISFASMAEWVEVERKEIWETVRKSLSEMYQAKNRTYPITKNNALKAISSTDDELRVANYIVLFGGRDLEWVRSGPNPDGSRGEFFSKSVVLDSSYTKTGTLYVDWEHGQGPQVDGKAAPGVDDVLGVVDWKTAKRDEYGVWVERVLDRRNRYVQALEGLIEQGLIGTSSQAIPDKVKTTKSGEITNWPLYRDSLTVEPCEPRMLTANVLSHLKTIAEVIPSAKALLEAAESSGRRADDNRSAMLQAQAKAWLYATQEEQP
jgi:hypothetical protein